MRKGKLRSLSIILAALVVAASAIRFFVLPFLLSDHIEQKLDHLSGYQIAYEDYSISLFTASVTLKNVTIKRSSGSARMPLFETSTLTAGLDWHALTKGFWVARILAVQPRVNFINSPDSLSRQTRFPDNWPDLARELVVLPVNSIAVRNGEIVYHDYHSAPKVVLHMTDVALEARNLQNANGDEKILSGFAEGSARVRNAEIKVDVQLNALLSDPVFQLNAELTELNLIDVRDFLRAYGQFDVQQGLFSLYTQAGTQDNKIVGFVKPHIRDITLASLEGKQRPVNAHLIRLSMRSGTEEAFQVTSPVNDVDEIQFEGSLAKNKTSLWAAVGSTLHNTFVEALVAMLEQSVQGDTGASPRPTVSPEQRKASRVSADVKKKNGFLRKIFKRNEKQKEKRKKK